MDFSTLTAYEHVMTQDLPDIHSTGYLLCHKKTGARVMLIENDDENKVFNIAFRTPPVDSTGVAHILEHSVLCGSRLFPLKDPFVELAKGSLNTFLNAMTFPDKTCYPVASCNDRDFQNLMHVYLDAVFYPNIYKKEEIFRQEGWHYHLENPEDPLTYNGVVYNEMKGAFSSPDEVLEREIMNHLFPDTSYGVESGGDPKCIPDLTYEQFLDFHRKYYHPSNCFIYLYGNMDMAGKLDFIDREYLSSFDRLDVDSALSIQKPFEAAKDVTRQYPVSESEDEEDQTYLSYNVVINDLDDPLAKTAFEILDYALLSAPGAPLKMALLEAGIGSDIYGSFEDGILQPFFSVIVKGANQEQKQQFLDIVRRVLEKEASCGIDRKALKAGINYYEFRFREADYASYPKGLMYSLDILSEWLYSDRAPFAPVMQLADFERLKEALDTDYFERLIRTHLLDNPHCCILTLAPSKGLMAVQEKELADRLAACKASLAPEQITQLVEQTEALRLYQEAEEDPAALACIPMLSRDDISPKVKPLSNEELEQDGCLLLYHDVPSNGIGYIDLMFDYRDMDIERIHYLSLLKSVLGYMDTEHYTYGELFNEINSSTGGLSCGIETFDSRQDSSFLVMAGLKGKALYENLPVLFDMAWEIISGTKLGDTKRLSEIVSESRSRLQAGLIGAGHGTAVSRASSYASPAGRFQDEVSGIGYYRFLDDLEKNFEEKKDSACDALKSLCEEVFCRENLKLSYGGEKESLPGVRKLMHSLWERLPRGRGGRAPGSITCRHVNEGFGMAGQVQYVAQCGNFLKKGYAYTGALDILKVILSYDYLWMNLRVKGGAYGCMSGFKYNGESYFVSYRDPHLHRTLEVYKGIPDYIRSFDADEQEMTRYIIGTMSSKDIPRTPQMQAAISRTAYFGGMKEEDLQKIRDQILGAGADDIRALAPLVEAVLSDHQICVLGAEKAVGEASDVLDEIKGLL